MNQRSLRPNLSHPVDLILTLLNCLKAHRPNFANVTNCVNHITLSLHSSELLKIFLVKSPNSLFLISCASLLVVNLLVELSSYKFLLLLQI